MRRLVIVIVTALMALVSNASPASAVTADAGAWVVAPNWWGWCGGGKVTKVIVTNYTTGTTDQGWDGADKVYIKVKKNMNNNIQTNVRCQWVTPHGAYHTLNVGGSGQTFFVGYPSGVYRQ